DAADHLADALLALGGGHAAAEVLLRDDVRRRLRPELRELDALLLERGLVLAGDEGVARLPLDLVERVAPGDGEVAANAEGRRLVDDHVLRLDLRRRGGVDLLLCAGHAASSQVIRAVDEPAQRGTRRLGRASDGTGIPLVKRVSGGVRAAAGPSPDAPSSPGG